MFTPIKHTKISEEIVNQVKNLIAEGRLRPGDRLPPERELMKHFGVSRPTLREALKALIALGFLQVTPDKKTIVRSIVSNRMEDPLSHLIKTDTQKIFDLIEVRKGLEAWSSFYAAQRATEDDLRKLDSLLREMKAAFEKGRSWEKEDADFHLAIAQATQNTIQAHLMSTIYGLLRESVAKVFTDRGKIKRLIHQHAQILHAIKNRWADKARERTLEHLNYVESEVKAFRDRRSSS